MGYLIQYTPEFEQKYPARKKRRGTLRGLLLGVAILVMIGCVRYRAVILEALLPGDPETTSGAFQGLISELRDGEPAEALAVFCREIIDNGAG